MSSSRPQYSRHFSDFFPNSLTLSDIPERDLANIKNDTCAYSIPIELDSYLNGHGIPFPPELESTVEQILAIQNKKIRKIELFATLTLYLYEHYLPTTNYATPAKEDNELLHLLSSTTILQELCRDIQPSQIKSAEASNTLNFGIATTYLVMGYMDSRNRKNCDSANAYLQDAKHFLKKTGAPGLQTRIALDMAKIFESKLMRKFNHSFALLNSALKYSHKIEDQGLKRALVAQIHMDLARIYGDSKRELTKGNENSILNYLLAAQNYSPLNKYRLMEHALFRASRNLSDYSSEPLKSISSIRYCLLETKNVSPFKRKREDEIATLSRNGVSNIHPGMIGRLLKQAINFMEAAKAVETAAETAERKVSELMEHISDKPPKGDGRLGNWRARLKKLLRFFFDKNDIDGRASAIEDGFGGEQLRRVLLKKAREGRN